MSRSKGAVEEEKRNLRRALYYASPWLVSSRSDLYRTSSSGKGRRQAAQQKMSRKSSQDSGSKIHKVHKEPVTTSVEYDIPDGGYGWVVVFSAFVFISLPMGISASFALYFEEWSDVFNEGTVKTALVGSVNSGCVPLLGSLGGMMLVNLFNDIRLVGIIGCFLSSAGFILSSFMTNTSLLAITYGAMGGFGMGLMFNCAYLSVGYYFDKNRPFATAIASSGTGFGTLISLLISQVISAYGWRGSLIIIAGVCIQCIACGMLIRPLYAKKVTKPTMSPVEEFLSKKDQEHTKNVPTNNNHQNGQKLFSSHDAVFRGDPRKTSGKSFLSQSAIGHLHHRRGSAAVAKALTPHSGDVKLNPYHRKDVFFSGSTYDLEKIENERRKSTFASQRIHHQDEEHIASQLTIDDIPTNLTGLEKIKQNLKKNFRLAIFKNPTYILFVMAMTLHHSAFFIPYTYVISLAKEQGIDQIQSKYLIICCGLSNFFHKLLIGRIMTYFEVEQLFVVITTLILGSTAAVLFTFCQQFWQFVLVAIMYGGTSPIVTIYVTNILVKYLGIANLTNAFSIVTIIRGLGSLSGPPLAGFVKELTSKSGSAFYVGATADILSAVLFGLILYINRKHDDVPDEESSSETAIDENSPLKEKSDNNLLQPKVIVTVPTAEGKLDKMIHYSNERFDGLAVRDQKEHGKLMRERAKNHPHSEDIVC